MKRFFLFCCGILLLCCAVKYFFPYFRAMSYSDPPKMGRDGMAGGQADDKWQTVQSGGREIYVMTNGTYSATERFSGVHDSLSGKSAIHVTGTRLAYGFRTYIVTNLPESDNVGAPQSVMNYVEGDCDTRHYQRLGSLFFAGKNRSGDPMESLGAEGTEKTLVPGSPFEKAFDILCKIAEEKEQTNPGVMQHNMDQEQQQSMVPFTDSPATTVEPKTQRKLILTVPAPKNVDLGHEWMKYAPAFCQSYSNLTPEQMNECDEAGFRYFSENWENVVASNGNVYEIALDTVSHDLPNGYNLRAAMAMVYGPRGGRFNPDNVITFTFDCHDHFQTFQQGSGWSPVTYAAHLSVAAKVASIACASAR